MPTSDANQVVEEIRSLRQARQYYPEPVSPADLATLLDAYLSTQHRDHAGNDVHVKPFVTDPINSVLVPFRRQILQRKAIQEKYRY